jgi:drug/metabolite transporter (DMT)-like permease
VYGWEFSLEALCGKEKPGINKILAVIVILIGTVLATNLLMSDIELGLEGYRLGFY